MGSVCCCLFSKSKKMKINNEMSILANLTSKKQNIIFELSDNDFQNNKVDNILDKSQINDYLIIYNGKSLNLKNTIDNKINNKKNLKKDYIYWISLKDKNGSISNYILEYNNVINKPLIGISIDSIDNIDENIRQVEQIHIILKQKNLQLEVVKAHFSLLFRDYEDLVDYCKNNNILFFADVFMEYGALSRKYGSNNLMDDKNKVGMFFNSQIYKN